jgi:hypothetical protein
MNEQAFLETIHNKAVELNMNPLLLLSGIEGLYSFKDVQMNAVSYDLLDSLVLTIFALRIGDNFHSLAEENLQSNNESLRSAAGNEMVEMNEASIENSANIYLRSFAKMLEGRATIRRYHEKALEVAAMEIGKEHNRYQSSSIGSIMIFVCKTNLQEALNLDALFNN